MQECFLSRLTVHYCCKSLVVHKGRGLPRHRDMHITHPEIGGLSVNAKLVGGIAVAAIGQIDDALKAVSLQRFEMVAGNLAGACERRGVGSKVRDFLGR